MNLKRKRKGHIFIKKSASWYFIDRNFIQLFFISKFYVNPKIKIGIVIQNAYGDVSHERIIKTFTLSLMPMWREKKFYRLYSLRVKLNNDIITLDSQLFANITINQDTSNLHLVKLRYRSKNEVDHAKSKSMVCVKNYRLEMDSLSTIQWWLSINKKIGFEKIVIYNNSISNGFDKLFSNFKDLVEIRNMQCIPNFVNKISGKYIRLVKMRGNIHISVEIIDSSRFKVEVY